MSSKSNGDNEGSSSSSSSSSESKKSNVTFTIKKVSCNLRRNGLLFVFANVAICSGLLFVVPGLFLAVAVICCYLLLLSGTVACQFGPLLSGRVSLHSGLCFFLF